MQAVRELGEAKAKMSEIEAEIVRRNGTFDIDFDEFTEDWCDAEVVWGQARRRIDELAAEWVRKGGG